MRLINIIGSVIAIVGSFLAILGTLFLVSHHYTKQKDDISDSQKNISVLTVKLSNIEKTVNANRVDILVIEKQVGWLHGPN